MSVKETVRIAVSKRSTAIIEETYDLEVDKEEYDKIIADGGTTENAACELESTIKDYSVKVEDICCVHERSYEE